MRVKKKNRLIFKRLNNRKGVKNMGVTKNTGEIREVETAIRVLEKEIEMKLLQKSKLNPIRDFKKIGKIESLILKKDKQRIKLKQRLK